MLTNNHFQHKIAVVGLGYVGLPLAVEFGKKYRVIGFDIDTERVMELSRGYDRTKEVDVESLRHVVESPSENSAGLSFTYNLAELSSCDIYIVTIPTPIDKYNNPNLTTLHDASLMIGSILKKGDIVIYESTVYPGCTEEECVPLLEKASGLKFNVDFLCGYSPERINPGDKINTFVKIKKITSGSTPHAAEIVDKLYNSVLENGTHRAPSIRVAEAAKAIENAQRDVNISFINELALIFDRMGIDTNDVIEAAATKWNFQQYRPGLVGGHCISVDPYYLAHKAEALGYHPDVILSGRRVNNRVPEFIAHKVLKLMIQKDKKIKEARVLILGFTFKENCPDFRNTKVIEIGRELEAFGVSVDYVDPWVDVEKPREEYGVLVANTVDSSKKYDAVIACVAHSEFLSFDFKRYKEDGAVIYDVKNFIERSLVDGRL